MVQRLTHLDGRSPIAIHMHLAQGADLLARAYAHLYIVASFFFKMSPFQGCDATSHAYDFLLLVQQWPRDFGQNDDYTTLHGLWPSRDGTAGPVSCTLQC